MGEQQQETTVATSPSSSTVLAVIAVVIVAAVVVWLNWGTEHASAPTTGPAQPVAAIPEPAKPRPTVGVGVTPELLSPTEMGTFKFGGVLCAVIHYDQRWRGWDQQYGFAPEAGYPRTEGNSWEMKGKWSPNGNKFAWHQTIQRLDPQTLDYNLSLKSDAGVQTNALAMGINLPVSMYSGQQIIIDGEPLTLPVDPPASADSATLMSERPVKTIDIATGAGQLAFEGSMQATVVDNRAYRSGVYYIRIAFTPDRGLLTDTNLRLKIRQVSDPGSADTAPDRPEPDRPQGVKQ